MVWFNSSGKWKIQKLSPFFLGLRQRATRSRGIVRGERCEDALGLVECTLAKSRKKKLFKTVTGDEQKKMVFKEIRHLQLQWVHFPAIHVSVFLSRVLNEDL